MISAAGDQREQVAQAHIKKIPSIKSVPTEIVIMIIEILEFKDALEFCNALHVPEQLAVQCCYFYQEDIDFLYDTLGSNKLNPNSFKFLLKNKRFQMTADLDDKTLAALKTFDLDFLKNYIEEFKPDLDLAFLAASRIGFTDAVKFLLSDSRIDPSAWDNQALREAAYRVHVEIVKLLMTDCRVDPSAWDNQALIEAARNGNIEIVKLLLSDSRVQPAALDNRALRDAARNGNTEIVKLLLSDSRVNPSALDNQALREAAYRGHVEIMKILMSDYRIDPSARDNEALRDAARNGNTDIVKLLLPDSRVQPGARNSQALRDAANRGHVEIVKLLLSYETLPYARQHIMPQMGPSA